MNTMNTFIKVKYFNPLLSSKKDLIKSGALDVFHEYDEHVYQS